MILLLQLFLSAFLTILFAINIELQLEIIDVLKVILVFIGFNLAITLLILIIFILLIYITSKSAPSSIKKHKMFNHFNYYIFNFLFRVKPIVTGKENLPKNNNFVVYSNHVEYTDPFYIKQVYKDFPLAFIAKEELFKIPLIRTIISSIGCIPLSRKVGDRQALQAVLQAINQVKNGQPIAIFPAGTRTHANTMNDFKPGAFKTAQKAKADISLVVLYNFQKTVKTFKLFKAKIYLKVLPLIKYDEYKDLDTNSISDLVYIKIKDELESFKDS